MYLLVSPAVCTHCLTVGTNVGIHIIKMNCVWKGRIKLNREGGQRAKERKTENEQGKIRRENEKCI